MNDDSISCANCCYWAQLDDGDTGQCRLHAPRPRNASSTDTQWPITLDDDWCGQWDCEDEDEDDSDDLVDAEFEDIVERLTTAPKRRWWRRGAA